MVIEVTRQLRLQHMQQIQSVCLFHLDTSPALKLLKILVWKLTENGRLSDRKQILVVNSPVRCVSQGYNSEYPRINDVCSIGNSANGNTNAVFPVHF